MYRSLIDNSIDSEDKENTGQSTSRISENESISEMFKKMSISDRMSKLLSSNNMIKEGFMTSSPIHQQSKLTKPIFNKIEPSKTPDICMVPEVEDDEQLKRSQTMKLPPRAPRINNQALDEKKETLHSKIISNINNGSLNRSNTSLMSNKVTIPKPFSFENKDKLLIENRKKLLQDDLLEKKRLASAFKANPMPISSPVLYQRKLLTSASSKLLFNDSNNGFNPSSFYKAKDLSYLHKSPVKLKPSTVPLTCPETPHLLLPSRLERRKIFEENQQAREQLYLKVKESIDNERLQEEKNEIKQLRREIVIKANPIRNFKNVTIEHTTKTTVPYTPKFSNRFKK